MVFSGDDGKNAFYTSIPLLLVFFIFRNHTDQMAMKTTHNTHYRQVFFSTLILTLTFLFQAALLMPSQAETLVPLHVQKGTNLIRIARQYCTNPSDWKTIAAVNRLKSPYIIYSRSTIQVPLSILRTKSISAKVASISGSPILVTGDSQTREIRKGDLVLPGQTVVTEDDEYVHLIYPNNKHTRIGPQSKMLLVYLMRLADDNLQAEFLLKNGRITHKVNKKLGANEHFRTRTPMAITGIRGTEFRIKIENQETNIVETLKGKVALSAAGKQILIKKGEGSKVKEGRPPEPPHALPPSPKLPQMRDIYRTLPVTFAAPAQKNIQSMRLRVTSDIKGLNTLVEQNAKPGQNFTLSSLTDGHYFLFFTGTDKQGFESLAAGPAPLHIRTNPGAPIISSPNNNRKIFDTTVTIRWLKSDQADHYKIQLATDPEFTKIVDEQQLKEATYTTAALKPGKYFFRVQLVTGDGFETLFSSSLAWEVMARPKLGNLNTSAQGKEGGITLQWPAMADTAGYALQIANDKEFTDLIVSENNLTEPSYTINFLIVSGEYYVRIRSITKDGQKSPWTPPQTMTIDSDSSWMPHAFAALGFIVLILIF